MGAGGFIPVCLCYIKRVVCVQGEVKVYKGDCLRICVSSVDCACDLSHSHGELWENMPLSSCGVSGVTGFVTVFVSCFQ